MTTVTEFTGKSRLKTPVPKVLAKAAGEQLQDALVLGWDKDGKFYFSASSPDAAEALFLLRLAEHELMVFVKGGRE